MPLHDFLHSRSLHTDMETVGRLEGLFAAIELQDEAVRVKSREEVKRNLEVLPVIAAFGGAEACACCHMLAWRIAAALDIFPASIDEYYHQLGQGNFDRITVPAMNMRAIAFEMARGVFQAMKAQDVGAAIFELSRGEIGFTGQRPYEYATSILCAAVVEGHRGPLFLQGDHFQISASRYNEDAASELQAVKELVAEAVSAGFYNIDIDCSTLVDLSQPTVAEQQRVNVELTAELVRHTRLVEPKGVSISLGGEIGEVGEENSTVCEVEAYLSGISDALGHSVRGLSKLSIQSGTRHGGNVLPDGSFGDMNVDFDLIANLTAACRENGGLAGCVQHGASMLPMEKIRKLPQAGCIEVHLAAGFLNAVYDLLPGELVREADSWVKETHADEWHADMSEAQFLHHARRYPIKKFKRDWWGARSIHDALRAEIRGRASSYFSALGVDSTKQQIAETVRHLPTKWHGSYARFSQDNDEAGIRDLAD